MATGNAERSNIEKYEIGAHWHVLLAMCHILQTLKSSFLFTPQNPMDLHSVRIP
jgi:hypothetical protein